MSYGEADDTIFAVSSGFTAAAISVVRVSGPRARDCIASLSSWNASGRTSLRWLRSPRTGALIDQALVLWFPGPGSATGEDIAEFHVHGSPAVRKALLGELAALPGMRPAEPGEFTRRALLNGKLDLSEAEGLADLLAAETSEQHRQAMRQLAGGVGSLVSAWRDDLVTARALVELEIDFSEESIPEQRDAARVRLERLVAAMQIEVGGAIAHERIRDGFEVAIIGRPNVGKSTLLNHIARREVALTSSEAGTTRDVLELRLDIEGLPVTLLDTAGLRDAESDVELRGIERARTRATNADLRVFLVNSIGESADLGVPVVEGDIIAHGKSDLRQPDDGLAVSGTTGDGVGELLATISGALRNRISASSAISGERQRLALSDALAACKSAVHLLAQEAGPELVAEEIRLALAAMDRLVGRTEVESILDDVFARFCIGK